MKAITRLTIMLAMLFAVGILATSSASAQTLQDPGWCATCQQVYDDIMNMPECDWGYPPDPDCQSRAQDAKDACEKDRCIWIMKAETQPAEKPETVTWEAPPLDSPNNQFLASNETTTPRIAPAQTSLRSCTKDYLPKALITHTTTVAFRSMADPCKENGDTYEMCHSMANVMFDTCRAACSGDSRQCTLTCQEAAHLTYTNCMREWGCPIIN